MFNFIYNGKAISVKDAPENFDDWTIRKSEILTYEKSEVILKAFIAKFPHITLLGDTNEEKYEYITKVASRNKALLEWFTLEKLNFSELATLPGYLKDIIDPKSFKRIQKDITKVNDTIAKFSEERVKASEEYKRKLKDIDRQEQMEFSVAKSNKIVKILTLTSQSLPMSMAFALEKFNTKAAIDDFEEKKKLYIRELLTNFKVTLIKFINDNPDTDVDDLINQLILK